MVVYIANLYFRHQHQKLERNYAADSVQAMRTTVPLSRTLSSHDRAKLVSAKYLIHTFVIDDDPFSLMILWPARFAGTL